MAAPIRSARGLMPQDDPGDTQPQFTKADL